MLGVARTRKLQDKGAAGADCGVGNSPEEEARPEARMAVQHRVRSRHLPEVRVPADKVSAGGVAVSSK
jgi:hypothetical protein